jgi:hypothetical protein
MRNTLAALLRPHPGRGLSPGLASVDELFHRSTFQVAGI